MMHLTLLFGFVLFLFPKLCTARRWEGKWEGDFGPFSLFEGEVLPGAKLDITGEYEDGRVLGVASTSRFEGIYVQPTGPSNTSCTFRLYDSFYWGRVEWIKVGSDALFGYWNYCFDSPSRKWNAVRQGARTANFMDKPFYFTGKWDTTYGDWYAERRFPKVPDEIWGPYGALAGYISGKQIGLQLNGTWVADISGQKCRMKVGGSLYWGKIEFSMKANLKEFAGMWGYCTDVLGEPWTGTRIQ